MKPRTILYLMVAVCAAIFAFFPNHLTAQSDTDSAAVSAAIQEVQGQQATLADNQKQIDAKLAAINETLRQARLFVARGGRKMKIDALILISAVLLAGSSVLRSQDAPAAKSPLEVLKAMKASNADLIDKQKKTLDGLDAMQKTADQIKAFAART